MRKTKSIKEYCKFVMAVFLAIAFLSSSSDVRIRSALQISSRLVINTIQL